jgi:glycosyltransferase involved in cell wall biosynthesis
MKILMLAPGFSPRSSSTSMRATHLAKYLNKKCQVTVLTIPIEEVLVQSIFDSSLQKKVEDIDIIRVKTGLIRKIQSKFNKEKRGEIKEKLKRSKLSSILIPDPYFGWIPRAYYKAIRLVKNKGIDVVISFGYPWSSHIVGYLVSKRFNLKWIADYGDPWNNNPTTELRLYNWRLALDKKLEEFILKEAQAITVTTKETQKLYEENFSFLKGKVFVVPMGYDPDDYRFSYQPMYKNGEDKLILTYTGRLFSEARDTGPFLKAVSEMKKKYENKLRIRINLVGDIDEETKYQVHQLKISDIVKIEGWVPFEESIQIMKQSDFLLLFGNKGGIQIPGKFYNYIGAEKPIFYIQEDSLDPVPEIINKYKLGLVCKNVQENIFLYLCNINDGIISSEQVKGQFSHFSWENVSEGLFKLIKSI